MPERAEAELLRAPAVAEALPAPAGARPPDTLHRGLLAADNSIFQSILCLQFVRLSFNMGYFLSFTETEYMRLPRETDGWTPGLERDTATSPPAGES